MVKIMRKKMIIIKKLVMNSDKNDVKISFEKFANILTKFDKSLRKKTFKFHRIFI